MAYRQVQLRCPHCHGDFPVRMALNEADPPAVRDPDTIRFTVRCRRCGKISPLTGRNLGFTLLKEIKDG